MITNINLFKLFGSNSMVPSIIENVETPFGTVSAYEVVKFSDIVRALRQDPELVYSHVFNDLVETLILGDNGIEPFMSLRKKHKKDAQFAKGALYEKLTEKYMAEVFETYIGDRGESSIENQAILYSILVLYVNHVPDTLNVLFSAIHD